MGTTLFVRTYPDKIVTDDVLPYLDRGSDNDMAVEFNGKHMPEGFYDACREYGTKIDYPPCFVIHNEMLSQFVADSRVPAGFNDIWLQGISEQENAMVIWIC